MRGPPAWLVPCLALSLALILQFASPAAADFSKPRQITPRGVHAVPGDKAMDREGDTAYVFTMNGEFKLRIRRRGGKLSPIRTVYTPKPDHVYTTLKVAVDNDGHGVVVWDQEPLDQDAGLEGYVYARRFDRGGRLGRTVQVSPSSHVASYGLNVGVHPYGRAVIAWVRLDGNLDYVPYARTLTKSGRLGRVHRLSRGPDGGTPLIGFDRRGRGTLVWNDTHLYARKVWRNGAFGQTRLIRRSGHSDISDLSAEQIGVDRRGRVTIGCIRESRACALRLSPWLKRLGRVRNVSPHWHTAVRVSLGVAPNGASVIGWQRRYLEPNGVFLRHIRPGGRLGTRKKVSNGELYDIVLKGDGDGYALSTKYADGKPRIIRATTVRNGYVRRTSTVAWNNDKPWWLRAGLYPGGRLLVSWRKSVNSSSRIMISVGR